MVIILKKDSNKLKIVKWYKTVLNVQNNMYLIYSSSFLNGFLLKRKIKSYTNFN